MTLAKASIPSRGQEADDNRQGDLGREGSEATRGGDSLEKPG